MKRLFFTNSMCVSILILFTAFLLNCSNDESSVPTPPTCDIEQNMEADYFIDYVNGDDRNDGLSPETAWKHAPGDINAAENPANIVLEPGVTVLFRGGVIYPGTISIPISGTSTDPVTYRGQGWGCEKAIIFGADPIPGDWARCTVSACQDFPDITSIYYIDIADTMLQGLGESGMIVMDQIFEDSERLVYAHWPDQQNVNDTYRFEMAQNFTGSTSTTITDSTNLPDVPDDYWNGAVLKLFCGSGINETHLYTITDYDSTTRTITVEKAMRSRPGEDAPDPAKDKYAIMNHPYALDSPGEFFIDYTADRLYVMSNAQDNPAEHDIEISRLSGTNATSGFEILRESRSNLVIDGFKIKGFSQHGIAFERYDMLYAYDYENIVLKNNEISNNLGNGIRMRCTAINSITIDSNTIYYHELKGIHIVPENNDNIKIINNYFHENNDDGIQLSHNVSNGLIDNNTILNHTSSRGHIDAIKLEGSSTQSTYANLTLSRNVIDGTVDYGSSGWTEWIGLKVYNNIYFNGPAFVTLRNTVNGAEIIGNTCYNPEHWCIYVDDASATNVVIKNNILGLTWASPSVVGNSDNSNNYFIDHLPPNAGPDSKVGPADFFVDPENSDFHISGADAPVVDAGADVSAYTSVDKDGNTRPHGSGWDIGAYEYGSNYRFTTTID